MKRDISTKVFLNDVKMCIESGDISANTVNEIAMRLTKSRKHLFTFNYEKHLTNKQIHTLYCIVICISERRKLNIL